MWLAASRDKFVTLVCVCECVSVWVCECVSVQLRPDNVRLSCFARQLLGVCLPACLPACCVQVECDVPVYLPVVCRWNVTSPSTCLLCAGGMWRPRLPACCVQVKCDVPVYLPAVCRWNVTSPSTCLLCAGGMWRPRLPACYVQVECDVPCEFRHVFCTWALIMAVTDH